MNDDQTSQATPPPEKEYLFAVLTQGVVLQIDPTMFEIVGTPIGMAINSDNFKLTFSAQLTFAVGAQESKVDNVVTLRRIKGE